MFRPMRRSERELEQEQVNEILNSSNWCILSVNGDDGYPYGVPMNYAYIDGKFYMHGTAQSSHKAEAIQKCSKVCITVVSQHELEAAKFAEHFTSVVVFGRARVIFDEEDKKRALLKMMRCIAPQIADEAVKHCGGTLKNMIMIEVIPEFITGKSGT